MNTKKSKKNWKKIFGIFLATIISAGALAGIGVGAYEISKTTSVSNDFSEGHSIQLNLRLFRTDANGSILLNKNGEPIRIYDASTEEKNIEESALALSNLLTSKGLTNIQVSYGYSNVKNNQVRSAVDANNKPIPVFKDNLEPVGILYASFENAQGAFGLNDPNDEVNNLFNNKQIFDSLNSGFAYELEVVQPSYANTTGNYKITKNATTYRAQNSSLLTNKDHVNPSGTSNLKSIGYYDQDLMKDNKINIFTDRDGKEANNYISYTLKNDLSYSYWNSYDFGVQNKEYEELKKAQDSSSGGSSSGQTTTFGNEVDLLDQAAGDGSSDGSETPPETPAGPPTDLQKFQTEYTWFLWKDKQGLIDYLNSLIGIWYFNLYANNVHNTAFASVEGNSPDKQKILENLFPTEDDPSYVRNGTLLSLRKQINVVVNSLSETEKSFIASVVLNNGYPLNKENSLGWTPPLIKENDLIPVLYNFLNDKIFSPVTPIDSNNIPNDNKDGVSESVKTGWSFLESTNTDLQSFIGDYYVGTIDYRNFSTYFESPEKPVEPTEEEPNPIPEPYVTNQFRIETTNQFGSDARSFANKLNDANYKFPIINPETSIFVNEWGHLLSNQSPSKDSIIGQIIDLDNKYKEVESGKITLEEYNNLKKEFASKYFNSNNLFSEQYITPASIASSVVSSNLNPLYILLIVLGSIIFLVGIFVSIRYRIPGIFAFVTSGLVFVLSALIYNAFGYLFSFYSILALAVGSFLSFIVPSFLFRNIEKEVSEGSTLGAAILKSTKKYWKMSLDTHVMSILASLSFLFFGRNGNINFGAMLIISVFLSFILSGIIYFILLLFYVYVIQFNMNSWFISERLFEKLNLNKSTKKIYFYNKVSFFNKPSYIVMAVVLVIGLIGTIVVATNGPFFSIDFSNSSILIINNFNDLGITKDQVINALNITTTNAYVYDNELVIYTYNNLNINSVLASLSSLVKDPTTLASNLSVSTLTNEYAIKVVQNTLECMGIAIGFCSVWALLSLNIVSVIPFALIQMLSMLVTVGFTTLLAVPIDLNSVASFIFIFILSTAFSASLISSIKSSWDRKLMISKDNLKELINSIVSKITPNYVHILILVLIFTIFSMALSSPSLIFAFLILIFGILWLAFANNNMLVLSWFGFVLLRNIFNKELLKSKNEKLHHVRDYDSVNEQSIVGINC